MFRNYDRDKSNTLELGEVMHMCRQLGHMSYNEACFVQVGVDSQRSNSQGSKRSRKGKGSIGKLAMVSEEELPGQC